MKCLYLTLLNQCVKKNQFINYFFGAAQLQKGEIQKKFYSNYKVKHNYPLCI